LKHLFAHAPIFVRSTILGIARDFIFTLLFYFFQRFWQHPICMIVLDKSPRQAEYVMFSSLIIRNLSMPLKDIKATYDKNGERQNNGRET